MSEPPPDGDVFEITHQTRLLDRPDADTGDAPRALCCIIDGSPGAAHACEEFADGGFDYNLKGIILRKPDGHQMGCRFILKNRSRLVDYRCAPSNEWIAELRRSKRLGVADPGGNVMMVCDDLWTGDIEDVLRRFYSPDDGR